MQTSLKGKRNGSRTAERTKGNAESLGGGNENTLGSLGYMWQQWGIGACSAASHRGVRLEDAMMPCPSLEHSGIGNPVTSP
jgi:hypothetical protein